MYQDIRFLNQDACFLNQEERRQFLIISVSERDWKREHRLEFKMASDRFYIPGIPNEHFSQNWLYNVVNASRVLLLQPTLIFNFPGEKIPALHWYSKCKWIFRRFTLPFAAVRGLCERKYRWGARRISCKTSRGLSTHFVWFVGDVWSSYEVGPGESALMLRIWNF